MHEGAAMSSAGDPATRLVVDLAAYQPIEEGVNLSIHNVRLQQICVAKKRRRFLRRRPPAGDAANGSNHIQKEGILIIGTDRFVFGMVGEQDAQLPNKEKERLERMAARQRLLEEKSASRQQRVEERSALKAQKQEEKASQKASKEAAKALLKLEKDRVKFEGNGSRGNSMDRSGSRRLLMRRAGSSPQVVLLTDFVPETDQKTPEHGSSQRRSPSEVPESQSHEPGTPGTPYRGSRSYSNLGQLMSDSESTTPVAPGAASPTRAAGHNRSVSALSNGSTLNSPFGTQDSMQIPPSPLSVADVDSEQVAQKQGSLDVNGFPRITGLSTEQHTFTADIAFSQVLRIERESEEVTVFYRPNTMRAEELSRNPVANALAVTFLMVSEQAASDVVSEVERAVEQYSKGVGHLTQKLPLPGPPSLLLASHRRTGGQEKGEVVTVNQPKWGASVSAPASWDAFEPEHLQGPDTLAAQEDMLQVYVSTPLGTGVAQLSLPLISSFLQDEEAHIFVGVTMQQVPRATDRRGSLLVRRSIIAAGAAEDAETSSSSGAWQPQDSILEVEPSAGSAPGSFSEAMAQRLQGSSFGRLPKLGRLPKSRHVRLHCIVTAKPLQKHTWQSAFGLGGSGCSSSQTNKQISCSMSLSAGHEQQLPLGALLMCCAPALLLLLNRQWWLLLQLLLLLGPTLALLAPAFPQQLLASLRSHMPGLRRAAATDKAAPESQLAHAPLPPALGVTSQKWRVRLLRAEIVEDVFAAVGPSIAADVRQPERAGPKQPESKLDVLARAHGVTWDVAERYLMACDDKIGDAHKMLQASREWREVKLGGKDMLKQAQPHFETFKALFTHGVLGISRAGRPIWVMRLGEVKRGLKAYKATGATNDDFQRHVMFVQDYMYEVLDRDTVPGGRSIWIIDMKGVGLTDLGSEAMEIIKGLAGIVAAHYPERLYRNFIVNAPGFFSLIWRVAEPMLSPTTRRKIRLLHNKQDMVKSLSEEMDEEIIPVAYGGQNAQPLYEGKHEVQLRELVRALSGHPESLGASTNGSASHSSTASIVSANGV